MAKSVSVIIPNWNGLRHLRACLNAVLQQTYGSYQVILVDNGSTDGSCEFVAHNYPQVCILRSETNWGFAAGTNLGIRHAQSDYIATLNNDTEVEPTWLEELAKGMEADPRVGMCASKMLFYDRRQVINSAGIAVDRVGIAWDREGGALDSAYDAAPHEVFGPCAGAALYRRTMLEEIGLFDEDYFSYLEDVDLAWRAQASGWRCLYMPSARLYHVHAGAGLEKSPLKSYLLGRNKWWTILKNYPFPQLLAYAPLILAYDGLALIYNFFLGRGIPSLQGRLSAFGAFPAVLRKRRAVQESAGYSRHLAYKCLSPLESPCRIWQRYKHLQASTLQRAQSF